MLEYIKKRLILGVLLMTEPFRKMPRKTLEEKIIPALHENSPIFIKQEGKHFVILNNWLGKEILLERLTICVSHSPDGIFQDVLFNAEGDKLVLQIQDEQQRLFVKLIYWENEIIIGERLLDMQGTVNFRDVGGFPVGDTHQVAWGKIFRSGHLAKLHKKEYDFFSSLNIQNIIDFRGKGMAKRFRDKVPNPKAINFIPLPIESKGLEMRKLGKKILNDDLEDFDAEKILTKSYLGFIKHSKNEIKTVFQTILNAKNATLIHCTAGKDRTGFFIALILMALGVSKKTIIADFMASNHFREKENDNVLKNVKKFTNPTPLFPLVRVQQSYLEIAIEALESQFGNAENYLLQEIGISKTQIQQLKEKYLVEIENNVL